MREWIPLCFVLACCTQTTDWNVSYLTAGSKEFNSAKLFLPAKDPVNGMDVEFLQTKLGVRAYLQVHSHPTVPYEGNTHETWVRLKTDQDQLNGPAVRHEGGQRIFLSPPMQEFLLSSLKKGKVVVIELTGYKATVSAQGFKKEFEEMQNPPFNFPIHLPF